MKHKIHKAAGFALCAGLLTAALDIRLKVVEYTVISAKATAPVRLAVLSDLHNCRYGDGQQTLLKAVAAQSPDAVLLAGDIVDDKLPEENAWIVVEALAAVYPCFYVTGNHEWWSGGAERICCQMKAYGVTVLRGESVALTLNEQPITICGIDDPDSGQSLKQLERVGETVKGDALTVLIAHRPERISFYQQYSFDLVVCGHAHGGQWRIPGLLNGLYAPGQGLFPDYAGGRYDYAGGTMLVSRGLARESTRVPRIFNRPELVIANIVPKV
ncbi:MAG: metallophosphoesterase [Oscillibacter sp.]|nr:metallophosphoesterase [Oscillibacter sp.]